MWASIQLAEGGEPGKCSMMYKKTLVFCLFVLFFLKLSANGNGIMNRGFQKYVFVGL